MRRDVFVLCASKLLAVSLVLIAAWTLTHPLPVCWTRADYAANEATLATVSTMPRTNKTDKSGLLQSIEGKVCVKTRLFDNVMCAGDPWNAPWWRARIRDTSRFCVARTSTFSAALTQLALVVAAALVHLMTLFARSFVRYDPLDMVPAFFSIVALSSVLIVQRVLSATWDEIWTFNRLLAPSHPLPHVALTIVLTFGLLVAAGEWLVCHALYNAEQDRIEAAHVEAAAFVTPPSSPPPPSPSKKKRQPPSSLSPSPSSSSAPTLVVTKVAANAAASEKNHKD